MLRTAHLILISFGILLGVVLIGFACWHFSHGDNSMWPTGAMGAVALIALSIYLRYFLKKTKK